MRARVLGGVRLPWPAIVGLCGMILAGASLSCVALAGPDREEVERRAEDLLRRMTLEEKVGQLNLASHGDFEWDQIVTGRIGAVINFNNAADIARVQGLARQSRLGIPLILGLDVLHGFRTVFPVPLAETASFDPALAELAAGWVAREAASVGVQWTYAPMADLARDPRWGRIVEGSGEDPYLGRIFAAARVKGFHAGGLATAAKHFAGYGAATGGRDYDATPIPRAELRDMYLPPFRAAIEAGNETIMSAFNALDGVPATANPWLLTDVLRREWGFEGFVISDWAAIQELMNHGIAADGAEAARKALLAGVDMDLMSGLYDRHLANEVRSGRIPEGAIEEAARRVLRVKLRLGLFERADVDPARPDPAPTPASREAARRVARESTVLLKNERQSLPLAARSIAVVGPLADAALDQLGPHAARGEEADAVTLIEGIKRRAATAGIAVGYAPACNLRCEGTEGFAEAVRVTREADVVVAVLGEDRELSGEAASRASLTLPGHQNELVEALAATGKPVVVVLVAGRPVELGTIAARASSILMAWYPGTEGGPAVADILFGDVNPGGKLPLTWPKTVGQVPLYYNRLPTGRPANPENRFTLGYIDEGLQPLFPFGWGLSYTSFTVSDLRVETPLLRAAETLEVVVTVANTGAREGHEVLQLYIRQPVASRSRPVRELKAFEKVRLAPGETRRVSLRVPVADLGFHLENGTYLVEPGPFQVWVGANSQAELGGTFQVTDGLRTPAEGRASKP